MRHITLKTFKLQTPKFSYMLKPCQINEQLLELIILDNFYVYMIIADELQKSSLFSYLGYGLLRIDK